MDALMAYFAGPQGAKNPRGAGSEEEESRKKKRKKKARRPRSSPPPAPPPRRRERPVEADVAEFTHILRREVLESEIKAKRDALNDDLALKRSDSAPPDGRFSSRSARVKFAYSDALVEQSGSLRDLKDEIAYDDDNAAVFEDAWEQSEPSIFSSSLEFALAHLACSWTGDEEEDGHPCRAIIGDADIYCACHRSLEDEEEFEGVTP